LKTTRTTYYSFIQTKRNGGGVGANANSTTGPASAYFNAHGKCLIVSV